METRYKKISGLPILTAFRKQKASRGSAARCFLWVAIS